MPPAREKKKRARRGKKDKNAPKKPLSAYMCFVRENRKFVLEENPSLKVTEVAKELGRRWREMNGDDKKEYEALAAKDKERYAEEKERYEETLNNYDEDAVEEEEEEEDEDED